MSSNTRSAFWGALLGTALLCSYAYATGFYAPQDGSGGGASDLATVLTGGATTDGVDINLNGTPVSDAVQFGEDTAADRPTIFGLAVSGGDSLFVRGGASSTGAGGLAQLTGGASSGGNGNGGDVGLVPGAKNGSGIDGEIRIADAADTNDVHLAVSADGQLDFNNEKGGGGDANLRAGKLNLVGGLSAGQGLSFAGSTSVITGVGNNISIFHGATERFRNSASRTSLGTGDLAFGVSASAPDVFLTRGAAGRFDVDSSSGGAGNGFVRHGSLVEANTAVAASPNAISGEYGTVFTNEGATAENHHTLPTAVAGARYTFVVQDSDGIQVNAASGDTITIAGTTSAAGGFVSSTTVGDVLILVAINATEWVALTPVMGWTFDT